LRPLFILAWKNYLPEHRSALLIRYRYRWLCDSSHGTQEGYWQVSTMIIPRKIGQYGYEELVINTSLSLAEGDESVKIRE
jgi:hypothetical protein